MPDDTRSTPSEQDMKMEIVKAENPSIFDKVDYVYTSYAQFIVTSVDFRIALGDRVPLEGKVVPRVGIVMSHSHAKSFFEAMSRQIADMDAALQKLKVSDDEGNHSNS